MIDPRNWMVRSCCIYNLRKVIFMILYDIYIYICHIIIKYIYIYVIICIYTHTWDCMSPIAHHAWIRASEPGSTQIVGNWRCCFSLPSGQHHPNSQRWICPRFGCKPLTISRPRKSVLVVKINAMENLRVDRFYWEKTDVRVAAKLPCQVGLREDSKANIWSSEYPRHFPRVRPWHFLVFPA